MKNLVGYEESTGEKIENQRLKGVLQELEYYGTGTKQILEDYLTLRKIDVQKRILQQRIIQPGWILELSTIMLETWTMKM